MEIRDYAEADFDGVLHLLRQNWPEISFDPARLARVLKACSDSDSFELVCSHDQGRVVGFCEMHFGESVLKQVMVAYVDIIAVDESQRRTGLGSALMAIARGKAQRNNCRSMELEVSFLHEEARPFFEAHGFEGSGYTFSRKLPLRGV